MLLFSGTHDDELAFFENPDNVGDLSPEGHDGLEIVRRITELTDDFFQEFDANQELPPPGGLKQPLKEIQMELQPVHIPEEAKETQAEGRRAKEMPKTEVVPTPPEKMSGGKIVLLTGGLLLVVLMLMGIVFLARRVQAPRTGVAIGRSVEDLSSAGSAWE